MKRLIICLTLAISACSAPQQGRVALEEPVLEAPIMAAPVIIVPCPGDEVIASDGIGGTGCK